MSTPATPAVAAAPSASLLAIGDEVLRGEIINSNAAYLADQLFELGYVLREHRVVSDDVADIRNGLETLCASADVVAVTGGLGPTDDDRTVDVVCGMLGLPPVTHEPSLEAMKKAYAVRGFELTPNNLRQVRVPEGARPLPNPVGVAPGFSVSIGRAQVFFFPGVPREMQRIFQDHVVPGLRARLAPSGWPLPAVRTFHVLGMGESHVDHRLAGLLSQVDPASGCQVALHFRTAAPENHVKLVIRGPQAEANADVLNRLDREVRTRLGPVVYGADEVTLPRAVADVLGAAQATLAFAESCTGGWAGQLVTSEPGASRFFLGGVVAYSDEVKRALLGVRAETLAAHGAVSEPCAAEMAQGARERLGATVAVSITGIAGSSKDWLPATVELSADRVGEGGLAPTKPTAGGAEPSEGSAYSAKPVGTVCFGISGPRGDRTETKVFFGGRERIRRWAAYHALDLVRRYFAASI
jgi:nicotinamide-nucleotide amidase